MKKVFLTTEEQEIFDKFRIDPNEKTKSYLLLGTPGTGKTKITRILADKHFAKVYSSSEIKSEYERKKSNFVEEISKEQFIFLDDTTVIGENKVYGDSVNIVEEILLARFDYIESSNHNYQKIVKEIEFLNTNRNNPDYLWAGYRDEEEFNVIMNSRENTRQNWLNSMQFVTIINSNLSKSEFKEQISDRLFDRIKAHLSVIEFEGTSFRK